ncbi:DUF2851 family protein [Aestuariivivens sp. NBU2969]|uniref:DUF2851 family protein n=1 Tax=Aestuariivivens sp. NBU2969 TaxID=2873267 RepID=UPI001CBDC621|nr:DUF2851 family protein [Aestuariivivens sp. NBU2969]
MQEDFLHYLWKYKKIDLHRLKTVQGEVIVVKSVGQHNCNAGPDFFNAQLQIGEQLWAGNVEMHVKSADWFLHNHEKDKTYDNVILHVVWEHDTEVFRSDNTTIPTLQLKDYIRTNVLGNYKALFATKNSWINCENDFHSIDSFLLSNWLERLYFERLERKALTIESLLETSKNDWEAVLFKLLSKNFGLKVNGEAFFSMANATDFSIVRKIQSNQQNLEALFFGQSGLLLDTIENGYYNILVKDYEFLRQKFKLENSKVLPLQFFRLRPSSFPTIRLSQLANLYHLHQNLFSKIIKSTTLNEFYKLLKVATSTYWQSHYTFQRESKPSIKTISKAFVDLLLINTIIPLKYCYAKQQGNPVDDEILKLISEIKSEQNSIVEAFQKLNPIVTSALHSQALVQLKTEYCSKNRCLQCAIGNKLLHK